MRGQANLLALGLALCMVQRAEAQGFNRRYDAFEQGYEQGAWGIEKAEGGWLILSFSFEPDTIAPDSLIGITSIILEWMNEAGILQQEKRHKVPEHAIYLGWADCCDSTTAGGGYVTGGTIENFAGDYKVRLMRYDAEGDTLWTRTFGDSPHYWVGNQVKQTADGGFLIVGFTDAIYFEGGFVIKTDSIGDQEWMHTYGQGGGLIDGFESAVRCGSGYVLGGISYASEDNSNMWLQRIDSMGAVLWSKRWGGPYDEAQSYALALGDGHILAASTWGYANDGASIAPYLAKVDSADGSTIWEHEYGEPGYGKTLFAAKELPNTDLIACGLTYEGGNQQGLLLRTTSEGDSLWMRNYAYHDSVIDQGTGRFWDVLPTEDGGCIAAGVAYNPSGGPYPPGYSQDAWVVKVDSMGCIVPGCDGVGITEQVTNLGGALELWPNPLSLSKGNGQLHVGIHLPANFKTTGPLTLTVTSLDGKRMLQQELSPLLGRASESRTSGGAGGEGVLDISSLAAGTYALHLSDATRWLAGSRFVVE